MADAKKCDICGAFYMRDEFFPIVPGYRLTKEGFSSGLVFLDLCPECKEKLESFVESLKKENNNAED
jgi:hypothetical protein